MSGPDPAVEHSLPYTVKMNVRPSKPVKLFHATICRVEKRLQVPMVLTMERHTTTYSKMSCSLNMEPVEIVHRTQINIIKSRSPFPNPLSRDRNRFICRQVSITISSYAYRGNGHDNPWHNA